MGNSLIITTYNEESNIKSWCFSVLDQTLLPDEIIIVDNYSADKTTEIIEEIFSQQASFEWRIIKSKCNISEGRNIGISKSTYDRLFITDAGVILDKYWLHNLSNKLNTCKVVGGYYEYSGTNDVQVSYRELFYKHPSSINSEFFLPSSRSLALFKECWVKIGGYNESLLIAEDTDFDKRLKSIYNICFEPNAIVKWETRSSSHAVFKQQYLYSLWDAKAGQNTIGHLLITVWLLFVFTSFVLSILYCVLILLVPLTYYIFRILKSGTSNFSTKMLLLIGCHISKSFGYIRGYFN